MTALGDGALVLVVDDDDTVTEVLGEYLRVAGFAVDTAADGASALAAVRRRRPALVVLDLMLPGVDGLDVARGLRAEGHLPVVLLTALGAQEDRIAGLEAGADDYVVKPFSPRELVLRIQSVLRRGTGQAARPPLVDGDLALDPAARTASLGGRPLALTVREFDLLAFLLEHPGEVFRRDQLLQRVWGWTFGDSSTVTVHVRRLREKVEEDPGMPQRIVTAWGVGYRYDRTSVR